MHPLDTPLFQKGLSGNDVVACTVAGGRDSPLSEAHELIEWTRRHIWMYNSFLLAIVFAIWIRRTVHSWRRSRRRRAWEGKMNDNEESCDENASDSSSTLTGTATPPMDIKIADESSLLLPHGLRQSHRSRLAKFSNHIKALLTFQPHRPIPLINKPLPSNGATLLLTLFLTLNTLVLFLHIPLRRSTAIVLALSDRSAALFAANLPVLYLLAAKNQPLKYFTGCSYEALNIFHRRLGEFMCALAVVHTAGIVYVYFDLLRPLFGIPLWEFVTERRIAVGIGAFACYEFLYFTSLASVRKRWYEVFLASHIVLQAGGLAFLWFHYTTSMPYVGMAIAIVAVDRLLFRLFLNSTYITADLHVLDDNSTLLVSSNWSIPQEKHPLLHLLRRKTIHNGWSPTQHVFITALTLSPLQSHPFTIASAAPTSTDQHAWFSLLIRAHAGFSKHLLHHALEHPTITLRVDGPYGSLDALHMLQDADTAVLVAGGSGIAVIFPLAWALLFQHPRSQSRKGKGKVHLIWITHSATHASWIPTERWEELRERGLHLTIPPPTATHGRPDVAALVQGIAYAGSCGDDGDHKKIGVVVSGPDALNRDVRNVCAGMMARGVDVDVKVEKFGW